MNLYFVCIVISLKISRYFCMCTVHRYLALLFSLLWRTLIILIIIFTFGLVVDVFNVWLLALNIKKNRRLLAPDWGAEHLRLIRRRPLITWAVRRKFLRSNPIKRRTGHITSQAESIFNNMAIGAISVC